MRLYAPKMTNILIAKTVSSKSITNYAFCITEWVLARSYHSFKMKRSLNSHFKLLAQLMDLVRLFPAWSWEPNDFFEIGLLRLSKVGTEKHCSCQGLECINLQPTQVYVNNSRGQQECTLNSWKLTYTQGRIQMSCDLN